jgi:hypothetical protein
MNLGERGSSDGPQNTKCGFSLKQHMWYLQKHNDTCTRGPNAKFQS